MRGMKHNLRFLFQLNVSSSEYWFILYITRIYTQVDAHAGFLAKTVQRNTDSVTVTQQ